MRGIERRARQALTSFTLLDPERYTSLDSYASPRPVFRDCLRRLLPADWTVGTAPGIWCNAHPPEGRLPEAGFKIHLSTAHDRAVELLERIVPVLVRARVCFKVLVDEWMLDLSNSHMWSRGASGKFVTVYPVDTASLRELLEHLHAVTAELSGPYILSDKRWPDSHVLFYRYGAFRELYRLNVYGERELAVRTADGRVLPDVRSAAFVLPEGIEDPFPSKPRAAGDKPLLHGRYRPLAAMSTSAKGGVYRCLDVETQREVVLKEARPWMNRGRMNPRDAVASLRNEWDILQRLQDTGVAPRALDFFQEWEHSFLVMERAPGRKLSAWMAQGALTLAMHARRDTEDLLRHGHRFLQVARRLISAVQAVHARGVVLQDLSPNNVLWDEATGTLTLIDFEAALDPHDSRRLPVLRVYTPGFGTRTGPDTLPTQAGDQHALSRILGEFIYAPTPFFALAPHQRAPMLERVARERGLPPAFVRLALGVEEQPEQVEFLLEAAERSLEDVRVPGPLAPARDEAGLRRDVERIGDYLVAKMAEREDPLDLPTDYRRFTTNRLSLAYGAMGIALFLHRVDRPLPPAFREALLREASRATERDVPPGLYLGRAGLAWGLLELGHAEEARALLDTPPDSPLLADCADLFHGAAGVGLTHLFFHARLGEARHLHAARALFTALEPRLQRSEHGLFFETEGEAYHGLGHGPAGLAWFLLRLHQASGEPRPLEVARALMAHELAAIEQDAEGAVLPRSRRQRVRYPYWQIGAAGLASIALRFHAALGDALYLDHARALAAPLQGAYTVFPCNFMGMAGLGGLFVDLYQHTGEEAWRTEAWRVVERVKLFALERPEGLVFPGEDLVRVSTDLGTGSAGTGLFFHRLLSGGGVPCLDFPAAPPGRGSA